jgi:hypothetical protein
MDDTRKLDPALRAQLLERLAHRSARLAKCAEVVHPASGIDTVIALMAGHVMQTAIVLLGDTFQKQVLETVFDNASEAMGVCRFCHANPLREDKTMCQLCWDQAASDDEITDDELAAVAEDVNDGE